MIMYARLLRTHLRTLVRGCALAALAAVGILLGLVPQANADPIVNPANGHYYDAISVAGGIDWSHARDAAAGRRYLGRAGHLVTLTSAAEQQFVITNFPNAVSGNYLLGGYQDRNAPDYAEPDKGWRWVTGEPWSYTAWVPFQPDNGSNVEDFLHFFSGTGEWNDVAGTSPLGGYVVEYEFTPQPFDINGDGQSDLAFQNSATGQIVFWYMQGTTVSGGVAASTMPAAGYKIRGTADFNQDGSPDLVFQNSTTGQIVIWYMSGPDFLGGSSVALIPLAGYEVVGAGDFNGDGLPDLALQNSSTGRVVIWFMNGSTVTSGSFISLTPAAGYRVAAVNDLNTDSHPDLVLQDQQSNKIVIWYMSGISVTGGVSLPTPTSDYKVMGAGAFNGLFPSLVFQNTVTNQIAFWYLDGANVIGGGLASGVPNSAYQLVGPR